MRKMLLASVLSLIAIPAFAQNQSTDLQSEIDQAVANEYSDFASGLLYDNENTVTEDAAFRGPGAPGRGGRPGRGGNPGGNHRPGNPGGNIGHRPPGNPGGNVGHRPPGHRPGNPGNIGHRPPGNRPGHPGGNVGHRPPNHSGDRFPGRGHWGRGHQWWRGSYGSNWHIHYRWWPGFIYYRGACFAEDDDGYLFAGRTSTRAVLSCRDNSPVGGCVFVGCD